MERDETHALRQMVMEQAERLNSVREKIKRAKWALLDHDLERVRHLLNQIEETSGHLAPASPPTQVLPGSPQPLSLYNTSARR